HEDHPDYTSFYTFNDEVISKNIYLLLAAYETLGNEAYRKAAYRGMDFYLLSQLPSPQSGWAHQYDMNLKPAQARSYEPAAVCSSQTVTNIEDLQNFYSITGDRRFLHPIPHAIRWLEDSAINRGLPKDFTHAIYYELVSNKPLYIHHSHREGTSKEILRFWVGPEPIVDLTYGKLPNINTQVIHREYEHLKSSSPQEARAQYQKRKQMAARPSAVDLEKIRKLISSMDSRGAWLTDIKFLDTLDYVHNPPTAFRGIDTATYVNNMYEFIDFLNGAKR
ncbi:MAG: pectate lyase, partial [Terriglobia bacterium]